MAINTTEERPQHSPPLPWRHYSGKLRPQFSVFVHEVHDASGEVLISWGGFDGVDFSQEEVAAYIDLIVSAVNSSLAVRELRDAATEARQWLDDSNGNDDLTQAIKRLDKALAPFEKDTELGR